MTKAELIDRVAAEAGLSRAVAREVLDMIVIQATEILKREGRFTFSGLGSLEVVSRAERTARNPRTNEPTVIKAHQAIKFKAAKTLKEAVNQQS
ncbi:DNA-binding protein [Deltaproteobacteria bacterium Smac51]|nr:DNA-binding protein [Deltaproteobacteria bacterium Smac51]